MIVKTLRSNWKVIETNVLYGQQRLSRCDSALQESYIKSSQNQELLQQKEGKTKKKRKGTQKSLYKEQKLVRTEAERTIYRTFRNSDLHTISKLPV